MGVDAQIKPKKGTSLGSAVEVRDVFERFFPGIKFGRYSKAHTNPEAAKTVVRTLRKLLGRIVLVGPTTPTFYQGDLEGQGWAMQVSFDDSDSVPVAFLSFYGGFGPAIANFDELTSQFPWKRKVY